MEPARVARLARRGGGDPGQVRTEAPLTDYTTGFALAAGIMNALDGSIDDGRAKRIDGSLCQTAAWLLRVGCGDDVGAPSGFVPALIRSETGFGVVEHLGPCVAVDGLDVGWARPTTPLGVGTLSW